MMGRPSGRGRVAALRAQSEVVGVVILVGVFAVTASIVGVVIIGNVTEQADDEPLVDLDATATTDNVTLTHTGGDGVAVDDVDVILRQGSNERRDGLDTYSERRGNGDSQLTSGEKRYRSNPYSGGSMRVIVVHVPSNAVLYDSSIDID